LHPSLFGFGLPTFLGRQTSGKSSSLDDGNGVGSAAREIMAESWLFGGKRRAKMGKNGQAQNAASY
jgi:hypothetical protein